MDHTPNYQLSQWAKSDQVKMADFNADNAKIDAALHSLSGQVAQKAPQSALSAETAARTALAGTVPRVAFGRYVGDGADSRSISVGFTPSAVLVITAEGRTYYHDSGFYNYYGGLALTDHPLKTGSREIVSIQPNGFQVYYKQVVVSGDDINIYSNRSGVAYHYLAIG